MGTNFTPSQQTHFSNVGYIMLTHALAETTIILTKLGVGELAKMPEAGIVLPFGDQPKTVGVAPVVTQTDVQKIEALIGEINTRNGLKTFKIAAPIHRGEVPLPNLDCFGRQYPSVQEMLAMGKTKAQRNFTNSGWPKCMVGSMAFYISGESGESFLGKPIAQYEWRGWNGRVGQEARYIKPEELGDFLRGVGMSAEAVASHLTTHGVLTAPAVVVAPPEGVSGNSKRKSAKK